VTPADTADGAVHATRSADAAPTLGSTSIAALVRSASPGMRIARIAAVTAGLAAAGAVVGAVLGVLVAAAWLLSAGHLLALLLNLDTVLFFGAYAAVAGATLGSLAAWLLMRHVPLWKAIGGTALGTLAGAVLGIVGDGHMGFAASFLGIGAGAFLGFGTAACLLWLESARKTRSDPPDGGEPPRE
jgi:hypothetical protein